MAGFFWSDFLANNQLPVTNLMMDGRSGLNPVSPGFRAPIGVAPPVGPVPVPGSAPPLAPSVLHPSFGTPYPSRAKNLYDSPFVRDYLSPLLPEGEYQRQLGRIGMADPTNRAGQFALSQFGNTQRKYQAAQLRDPALSFRKFLRRGGAGGLMDTWRGMTSQQRGLNAPSRTSVIRLG